MNIPDEPSEPSEASGSRLRLVVGGVLLLVVVLIATVWLLRGRTAPPTALTSAPAAPSPVAAAPPAATEPATPVPAPEARPRARKPVTAAPAPAPVEPAAPALTLKVTSDVPGTDVFVDRVYVGKAPLETSDVKAGSHTLNASAEGYESQALPIEVKDGVNEVAVRFKVVRLNESIAVVHKHGIGSCEGRLVADTHGLRYETSNKDHAFDLPFADVQAFEVDYLQKNLKVTRKGGKTFNFTDRSANADALFVYHKKVQAARTRLAEAGK